MLTVAEAEARIMARAALRPVERVSLDRAAGLVLREEIRTDRDLPPFDRATMDGIAIAFAPGRERFQIEGVQAAGRQAGRLVDPVSGCMEIMTGAMCPDGADTVVPYEDVVIEGGRATLKATVERGQYLHRQGTDRKTGDVLLPAGVHLRSPQIAIAASAGLTQVVVAKPPRFAVVSVGDEIVEAGAPVERFQIRPSNAWGIRAALQGLGCPEVELARLPDDPARIEHALADLLARCDGLILSGGVSRGKFDYVPDALERIGVAMDFHKVAQKPGKPMWFGVVPDGKPVFALPGNPVSTLVCFHRYVKPFVLRALGAAEPASAYIAIRGAIQPHPVLTLFLPVTLSADGAEPQAYHGSGDYAALGESDGFIEVSPTGGPVRYYAWDV
ncbi:MAG TPA: molybdopterin molybdotransferase MoeA [Kiritimatiellia bacterium]|nr:molybdopterin molybdotransferase MoeA [Kiritimatiellia bacterium]